MTRLTLRRAATVAAAALIALGGAADRAKAELIVLASGAGAYEKGDILRNDDTLSLAAGETLRVMTRGGDTRALSGPETAAVGDLAGALDPMSDSFRRLLAYFGGDGRDQSKTLATRSAEAVFFIAGTPIAEGGGAYCYSSASKVTIERKDGGREGVADVTARGASGSARFAAGETAAPWPVRVLSNTEYTVSMSGGGSARVTLVRLGRLPGDVDGRIKAFAERGCFAQLEATLSEL